MAAKWDVSFGFVQGLRAKDGRPLVAKASSQVQALTSDKTFDQDSNGDITITKRADRVIPLSEWLEDLILDGLNPEDYNTSHGHSIWGQQPKEGELVTLYANRFSATLKNRNGSVPRWPVIQPARDAYVIKPVKRTPRASRFKTAVIGADTQIGFDMAEDGALTPYHDVDAIDVFLQIVAAENPDQTIIAGDIIDLTEQSRWAQEERFARTTQPSLEYARQFAAETRAATSGEIVWIEGNHDKRMSAFMETNAKSAMGLRKAGYPDSYPVLSIPNLVGLDEFDVKYIDAYPAGAWWITKDLRVIHGTKSNSAGSTASQYANATPHISTCFGHTHRQEVQSKTTFDRAGKIRTMNFNPGCLCRVDGMVPSVHGARHLDGSKATYWEDWQQGVSVVRYLDDGTFFVEQVQIDNGAGLHQGAEFIARSHQD